MPEMNRCDFRSTAIFMTEKKSTCQNDDYNKQRDDECLLRFEPAEAPRLI